MSSSHIARMLATKKKPGVFEPVFWAILLKSRHLAIALVIRTLEKLAFESSSPTDRVKLESASENRLPKLRWSESVKRLSPG